jgi:hypothetical protein
MSGTGDEAESGQLVLALSLGLIVVEEGEEGTLLGFGLLKYFLSASLSNPPFDLCLEVYSPLSLRLLESYLSEECLFFLG